jgi:putative hydrolase of the HAD superfamily
MPAEAVIFDLYGTLVDESPRRDWRELQDTIADTLGLERDPFAQRWLETYEERATGSWEANLRGIVSHLGGEWSDARYEEARRLRRDFLRVGLTPRPDAEATIEEVKRRGFKVGLVTECSDDVPVLWPELALARHFDAAVYTCEVGQRKPAPVLYDLVCEQLGVEAAECVYVGDGGGYELAGARKAGMRPILILAPGHEWMHDEAREWQGERISSLSELLELL